MKTKAILALSFVIFLALLLAPVQAQVTSEETIDGVSFYRITPAEAFIGQKVWVMLAIENKQSSEKNIVIKEGLKDADFDQTEAKYMTTEYGEKFGYYEWKIKLPANGNTSVVYWITPKTPGTYVISPAEITVDSKKFYLKSRAIEVRCNSDGKCGSGENYLNCPEDCQTGSADNICDSVVDGTCDPDCEKTADPDCGAAKEAEKPTEIPTQYIAISVIIIGMSILVFVLLKLKKKKK